LGQAAPQQFQLNWRRADRRVGQFGSLSSFSPPCFAPQKLCLNRRGSLQGARKFIEQLREVRYMGLRHSCRQAALQADQLGQEAIDQSQAGLRQPDFQTTTIERLGQTPNEFESFKLVESICNTRPLSSRDWLNCLGANVYGGPARRTVVSKSNIPRVMPWEAINRSISGAVNQ
jgi:hypothetical protein